MNKIALIIKLNFYIFFLLLLILIFATLLAARFSDNERYTHIFIPNSIDECLDSAHGKTSRAQAKILGIDDAELVNYCKSVQMISQKWSKNRTYWDYHYYSHVELRTAKLNFTPLEEFNSRKVPCSTGGQKKTIWLFGGSTMQNMETSDEFTIANTFCKNYREANVINLGVGSFFSELEIAKFLNLYKINIREKKKLPTHAIFYDGFNDSVRLETQSSWAGLPNNVSRRLEQAYINESSLNRAIYWGLRLLDDVFMSVSNERKNIINDFLKAKTLSYERQISLNESIGKNAPVDTELENKLLSSQAYLFDQAVLSGICKNLKVKCFVVLQPLLPLRNKPVGPIEQSQFNHISKSGMRGLTKRFYQEALATMKKLEHGYYQVIDMSDLPNKPEYRQFPFFYDFGHTGFFASPIIGRELSEAIRRAE